MVFQYCANRIPEISDELYRIDDGMRTGFDGKWVLLRCDAIGVQEALDQITYGLRSTSMGAFYAGIRIFFILQARRTAHIGISHQHRIKLYPVRNILSFLQLQREYCLKIAARISMT